MKNEFRSSSRQLAIVIAIFATREGIEAWKGGACATSVGMLLEEAEDRQG